MVGIAASTGALNPLIDVLAALPKQLDAAIAVAFHTGPMSILPELLQPRCQLLIKFATQGELVQSGVVYIAPPLRHIVVNPDRKLSVVDRARVRFVRPSADWLLDSIAGTYGGHSMAVVLSGLRDDGMRGAARIDQVGGRVVAQEPTTCVAPQMPMAAMRSSTVQLVLPPHRIAPAIVSHLSRLDLQRARLEFVSPFARLS